MRDALAGIRRRIRSLLRAPRVSVPAVLILAVAVGANAAMFGVVYGVLLRPLPFAEPDRLVALFEVGPGWWGRTGPSLPTLEDWRAAEPAGLEGMVAMSGPVPVPLTGLDEPVTVERAAVSAAFFDLLGVPPARGRAFLAVEDRPDATPVAVLSWSLWQSRFGGDPSILGRSVILDGRSHEVVGVAPEGFDHPDGTDVWMPLLTAVADAREVRGAHIFRVVGRLAPGATPERVTGELTAVSRGVAEYGGEWAAVAVREGAPPVALVSRSLARRLFPDQIGSRSGARAGARPAVGRRAHHAFGDQEMREIVGVVEDVRHHTLTEDPPPVFYVPFAQEPAPGAAVVVRADAAPRVVNEAVRGAVREIDPELPIQGMATMEERIARTVARPRFYAAVLGAFAAIALVPALGGFYAVLAHSVSRRRRELGVRVAVGADPGNLVGMVVGEGLELTAIGVLLGLAAAFFATRLLESLIWGVAPTDPVTFAAVPLLLLAVAALASWLPARRAARIDPALVLRE